MAKMGRAFSEDTKLSLQDNMTSTGLAPGPDRPRRMKVSAESFAQEEAKVPEDLVVHVTRSGISS